MQGNILITVLRHGLHTSGNLTFVADMAAKYWIKRLMLVESVALQHFPCTSHNIDSCAPVAKYRSEMHACNCEENKYFRYVQQSLFVVYYYNRQ